VREQGQVQQWCCGPRTSLERIVKNNLGIVPRKFWESNTPIPVDWISGAAYMIRKEIFEHAGGFDENFFMYFEDEDLCWRVRELGYEVYYLGNISIIHLEGKSSSKDESRSARSHLAFKKEIYFPSQDYFFKKHCRPIEAVALKILRSLAVH